MSYVKNERYLRIEIYALNKSKNLHSTVAVIISHDYHKGKFETKAQILGMRPAGAAAVLTVAVEILAFIFIRILFPFLLRNYVYKIRINLFIQFIEFLD